MQTPGRVFEELVKEILIINGYNVKEASYRPELIEPDIFAEFENKRYVFELKLSRSSRIQPSLINNGVNQVSRYKTGLGADRGVLIGTYDLGTLSHIVIGEGIEVWGIRKLLEMSSKDPDLNERFISFLNDIKIYHIDTELPPLEAPLHYSRSHSTSSLQDSALQLLTNVSSHQSHSRKNKSTKQTSLRSDLALKLENSVAGKNGKAASTFEALCTQALKLLFDKEMTSWQDQPQNEGGFHRFDLIARLVPQHSFWLALAQDFRTRYVIFEFKNYAKPIKQDQIYTTEKYLFLTAMRSVAIMIARTGEDKSSLQARKGALREHGKLILCLSRDDLCIMLRGFDKGDDPSDFMFDKLDKFLVELGR